jgi:hypothetical protein
MSRYRSFDKALRLALALKRRETVFRNALQPPWEAAGTYGSAGLRRPLSSMF